MTEDGIDVWRERGEASQLTSLPPVGGVAPLFMRLSDAVSAAF